MQQRAETQQVKSILLADDPVNLWGMRGRIPKCSEHSFEKIHQSAVFALLGLASETVEGQDWDSGGAQTECSIHELRSV